MDCDQDCQVLGELLVDNNHTTKGETMNTIYIYSNETGEQVAKYVGKDNADCESWAERTWGSNDYHWSYTDVEHSNAVKP